MDVLSYLSELIKTRKEVGIAGLGTIYKKKSPGRYDAATHTFLPPSQVLEFKTEVTEEDALVAYVSEQKNLSQDSSAYFVALFVEGLKNQLNASGEADLDHLGKLQLQDGNLVFTPAKETEIGFDFYGLPSVKAELPEVQSIPEEEFTETEVTIAETIEEQNELEERLDLEDANADLSDGTEKFDEQPVYEEISEPLHHTPPPASPVFIETPEGLEQEDPEEELMAPEPEQEKAPEPEPALAPEPAPAERIALRQWDFDRLDITASVPETAELPEEEAKAGTPAYVWVIVSIVIIAAIAIGLYIAKPEVFGTNATDTLVSVQKKDSLKAAAPVVQADTSVNLADPAKTDTLLKDTISQLVKPLAAVDTVTTWEVIAAAVLNQKEVDITLAQFKNRGIKAKALPSKSKKRRIKISIATYPDEASARAGKKELVDKLKDPELYIFQYKHTHK